MVLTIRLLIIILVNPKPKNPNAASGHLAAPVCADFSRSDWFPSRRSDRPGGTPCNVAWCIIQKPLILRNIPWVTVDPRKLNSGIFLNSDILEGLAWCALCLGLENGACASGFRVIRV